MSDMGLAKPAVAPAVKPGDFDGAGFSLWSENAPIIISEPRLNVRHVNTISFATPLNGINDCVRPIRVEIEKRNVKMPRAKRVLFMVDCFRR